MEGAANDGDINTTSTTSGVQITTLFRAFRLPANITTLSGNSVHNRSRVVRRWSKPSTDYHPVGLEGLIQHLLKKEWLCLDNPAYRDNPGPCIKIEQKRNNLALRLLETSEAIGTDTTN